MSIPLKVLVLGSGSAIPRKNKNHTCQLATYNGKHYLFDAGEGCQIQMKRYGASIQKIDAIFITHMHGDHYLGLPGLIFTMNLLGRQKALHVIGPKGVKDLIDFSFSEANARSGFPIHFKETEPKDKHIVYEDGPIQVESFPLKHKIPTTGYLLSAGSRKRKLLRKEVELYNVPKHLRSGIVDGLDFTDENGKTIPNDKLTADPERPKYFAFCTDTSYHSDLGKYIEGVDLMYHEATFLKEDVKTAKDKKHATAEQAATSAKETNAKKLLIGHFSNKYEDDNAFLIEARKIFKNTEIATEGETYEV